VGIIAECSGNPDEVRTEFYDNCIHEKPMGIICLRIQLKYYVGISENHVGILCMEILHGSLVGRHGNPMRVF
jgi:hypothetical protein